MNPDKRKIDPLTNAVRISVSLSLMLLLSWPISEVLPSIIGRHPGIADVWITIGSLYIVIRFAIEDRSR
jgi:hypothetical protein